MGDLLPAWCRVALTAPAIPDNIKTAEGAKACATEIYHDIIQKHRILETYHGLDSTFALDLIRSLCMQAIEEFRKGTIRPTMNEWLSLVSSITHLESHAIDDPIRLACESVVLTMYCRFIKHGRWVATPQQLLEENNYFDKERSHWWRKQKAAETPEHTKDKYDKMMADLPGLLNYYNAVLHTSDLLIKPTLKHTVVLSALTAEGRTYENGQGRSIASECRHLLVRRVCELPIKPRPQRVGEKPAAVCEKSKSRKRKTSPVTDESEDLKYEKCSPKSSRVLADSLLYLPPGEGPPKLNRLTSSDWPSTLGLDKKHVPTLLLTEKNVFTQPIESALLLSSSSSSQSMSSSSLQLPQGRAPFTAYELRSLRMSSSHPTQICHHESNM